MKPKFNISQADNKAEINILGYIGEDWWNESENTIQSITAKLKEIEELKADEITVNISSLGGDVDHALAIFDALHSKQNVTTIMTGRCASAATVIAMAGSVRKMSKYALFLIHKCSSCAFGNENALERELEDQRAINERLVQLYVDVTGKSRSEIMELMDAHDGEGRWLSSAECLDMGFITEEVAGSKKENSLFSMSDIAQAGLPPLPKGFSEDEEGNRLYALFGTLIERMAAKFGVKTIKEIPAMKDLKEQMPTLAALIGKVEANDDLVTLSVTEVQKIEDEFVRLASEVASKEAKVTELSGKVEELTAQVDDLTTKNGELSAALDKTAAQVVPASGLDPQPQEPKITDAAYYKSIIENSNMIKE